MTISSTTRRAGPFVGNDVTVDFPFAFKVFKKEDVKVVLADDLTGTETVLVLDSAYGITLNVDQDSSPGGTIRYPRVVGAIPMSNTQRLAAIGGLANLQKTDITNSGGFFPQVIEDMSDRSTIQIQQLEERQTRSLELGVADISGLGAYRVEGNRLQDVADPIFVQDATNKRYVDALNDDTRSHTQTLLDALKGYFEALIAGVIGGYGAFLQAGFNAFIRTFQAKMRDTVSVADFVGADSTGVGDSTVAFNNAAAVGAPYVPTGLYRYEDNLDLLYRKGLHGPGKVLYKGFIYNAARRPRHNSLWAGHFASWQRAPGISLVGWRIDSADGVSAARRNFSTGVLVFQVEGKYEANGLLVQRNLNITSTDSVHLSLPLAQRETRAHIGKTNVLALNAYKSETWTGGMVTVRVYGSKEPEQAITNADGTYTNGNILLGTLVFNPDTRPRPKYAPYYVAFDVEEDIVQISANIEIPFSGTANAQDWAAFEAVHLVNGDMPGDVEEPVFANCLDSARSRYESSYLYGTPPGSATYLGALVDITKNLLVNWSLAYNVRFAPKIIPPTVYCHAPNDGQDERVTPAEGAVISRFARVENISSTGAQFTNNYTPATVGVPVSAHYVAVARL